MAAPADTRKRAAQSGPRRLRRTSLPARPRDPGFERLVYERVRLGMMGALAARDELSFSELKELFQVSDGNLSAHARKLEQAGYVSCSKSFADRRPRTAYRLTALGRAALNRYIDHVEAVIRMTRQR